MLNVLARLQGPAVPGQAAVRSTLRLADEPQANVQRYDTLREEVRHVH